MQQRNVSWLRRVARVGCGPGGLGVLSMTMGVVDARPTTVAATQRVQRCHGSVAHGVRGHPSTRRTTEPSSRTAVGARVADPPGLPPERKLFLSACPPDPTHILSCSDIAWEVHAVIKDDKGTTCITRRQRTWWLWSGMRSRHVGDLCRERESTATQGPLRRQTADHVSQVGHLRRGDGPSTRPARTGPPMMVPVRRYLREPGQQQWDH